jgi:hypothetical protein
MLLVLLGIAAIVGVVTGLAKRKSDQITADVLSRAVPMMRAMGVVWTNRAAQIRAENADKAVTRRGRSFIEFDLGGGRTRHVATIEPLHTKAGDEIDTAWGAAVSPWQYQVADCDYTARIKATFSNAPLLQFTDKASGAWVTLQPQALNWTNDLAQIQQISSVQGVAATLADDTARWAGAYGAGRHFEYQNHPKRLIKRLVMDAAPPAPAAYILSGGNPVLQLQFLFAWSTNASVFIDGALWDKSTAKTTAGSIEFRVGGEVVYRFDAPWASDASENTTAGLLRVRKAGNNLYAEIRIPYAWLQAAVYPVVVDPSLVLQPGPAAGIDTRITESDRNYGASPTLIVQNVFNTNSLLQFDVSSIPAAATITAASLDLVHTANAGEALNLTIYVNWLTRSWVEGTKTGFGVPDGATWTLYDGVNAWTTVGGDFSTVGQVSAVVGTGTGETVTWNPVAIIQNWVNGTNINNGFILVCTQGGLPSNKQFASSDHATADYRPKLVIEYTEPVVGGGGRRWLPIMVARRCRG